MVRKRVIIGAAIGFTAAAAVIALDRRQSAVPAEISNTGPIEVAVDPDEMDDEPDAGDVDTDDSE